MLLLLLNFLDSDIQTTTDSLTHWGKTIMTIKPHDYCCKKKPTTADFCHCFWKMVRKPDTSGGQLSEYYAKSESCHNHKELWKWVCVLLLRSSLRYSLLVFHLLKRKQSRACVRHLLSHCFAAGTALATVQSPLCKYPKGCIQFKSSCSQGASRWRTKGSATSLLPARKQHRCIKRGLWAQAQLRSVQGAVSLSEDTKIIAGTQFYKLAARLRRFKCT